MLSFPFRRWRTPLQIRLGLNMIKKRPPLKHSNTCCYVCKQKGAVIQGKDLDAWKVVYVKVYGGRPETICTFYNVFCNGPKCIGPMRWGWKQQLRRLTIQRQNAKKNSQPGTNWHNISQPLSYNIFLFQLLSLTRDNIARSQKCDHAKPIKTKMYVNADLNSCSILSANGTEHTSSWL